MSDLSSRDFPVDIEDIMHTAYLQYSLSVNVGRAIPDVRDGLKPVNRRILYGMRQLNLSKSHATVKCARVVGEVMGKYHPHGDAAIYDALVRLAQDFSMRQPLVEGQGNFGNIDGDPAAASRYTECRMERLAEEMLADIEKDTVDMIPNFDESEVEPSVLPARFPQLLVNGTTGIGVGMATSIPPHNLGEVIDATVCLLDNPSASVDELMHFLPGPDFPTGAVICGRASLRQFYRTGRGSVKLRARAEVLEKDGREQIIITEIPYAIQKEEVVKRIADLVSDKRIVGISGLRDESSNRTGVRIVVDIKRGAMGSVVLNQLYAHTQLENVYGCTMLVVDHNRPRVMNLTQVLQAYIDHRLEVVTRRTKFELEKAQARAHILEGLLKALDNLDEVVHIIRDSRGRQEAAERLIQRFAFTKPQVDAILEMRLHQLTGLAIEDVRAEYAELCRKIEYFQSLLASRELRIGVIRTELLDVRERYRDERRTEITTDDADLNIADLIERHNCVITVSNTGYIKRVPVDTYRTQHRGGKGIIGMETKDEDYVEHLFNANSHDLIFFFTDKGFMHWLYVYEIPEGSRTSKGKAIVNLIKVDPGEKIRTMLTATPEDLENAELFIIMATREGYIKKTPLTAFKNLRRTGIRALTIEEDDDLIATEISHNGEEILLASKLGMACRFNQNDAELRPMGRTARGVTGMRFKLDGDEVVSMVVIRENVGGEIAEEGEFTDAPELENAETTEGVEVEGEGSGPEIIVVSSGGMGKRSCVSTYRKTRRGARGVVNIRLRENEVVVNSLQIGAGDELLITTERGQLVRIPCDEVRTIGRAGKGVRIMNLNENDRVTGVARMLESEEKDEENAAGESVPEVPAETAGAAGDPAAPEVSAAPESSSTDQNPDENA